MGATEGVVCGRLAILGDDGLRPLTDSSRGRFDRRNSAISIPVFVRVSCECEKVCKVSQQKTEEGSPQYPAVHSGKSCEANLAGARI